MWKKLLWVFEQNLEIIILTRTKKNTARDYRRYDELELKYLYKSAEEGVFSSPFL